MGSGAQGFAALNAARLCQCDVKIASTPSSATKIAAIVTVSAQQHSTINSLLGSRIGARRQWNARLPAPPYGRSRIMISSATINQQKCLP